MKAIFNARGGEIITQLNIAMHIAMNIAIEYRHAPATTAKSDIQYSMRNCIAYWNIAITPGARMVIFICDITLRYSFVIFRGLDIEYRHTAISHATQAAW